MDMQEMEERILFLEDAVKRLTLANKLNADGLQLLIDSIDAFQLDSES